jgi:hypothetical protein
LLGTRANTLPFYEMGDHQGHSLIEQTEPRNAQDRLAGPPLFRELLCCLAK